MFENLKDILWAANPKNRMWPPSRGPSVRGPQPHLISFEAALEIRRRQREAEKNGEGGQTAIVQEN